MPTKKWFDLDPQNFVEASLNIDRRSVGGLSISLDAIRNRLKEIKEAGDISESDCLSALKHLDDISTRKSKITSRPLS